MTEAAMSEQRRCSLRGNSWVVPIPRSIRVDLGILHGGDVFWHRGPKGEAVISNGRARVGGKPPGQRIEKNLAAAQRTIERLERRLRNRPAVTFNEGMAEGFSLNAREVVRIGGAVEALTREVRDLAARIPFAPRRAGRRVLGAVTSASAPPASIDHIPTEPLPSGVVVGGDAASGDSIPQAAHE
jgi:hypothetical protein